MKSTIFKLTAFLGIFVFATALAPSPVAEKATVKIDGKVMHQEEVYTVKRDDTVKLEASGIKPGSEVHIKARKAGISWMKDVYKIGESGEMVGIMHIPEIRTTANCFVTYYSADGEFHDLKFKLKIR